MSGAKQVTVTMTFAPGATAANPAPAPTAAVAAPAAPATLPVTGAPFPLLVSFSIGLVLLGALLRRLGQVLLTPRRLP